jgi:pyrimidine operon attenuation protein/uracil phosphoribosyltransferase
MRVLADEPRVTALIGEVAEAIRGDLSRDAAGGPWALIGIRSRGDVLARRLAALLKPDHVGTLDITLYRDDLTEIGPQAVVRTTEIPFAIDGLNVVLVDDVLMTGRSVRAALQSLIDLGRPKRVWLAVLADRGGRELPICPDHVGIVLPRDMAGGLRDEVRVEVLLRPTDDRDAIVLGPRETSGAEKS